MFREEVQLTLVSDKLSTKQINAAAAYGYPSESVVNFMKNLLFPPCKSF